jgi:hypothetical protein
MKEMRQSKQIIVERLLKYLFYKFDANWGEYFEVMAANSR